MNRFARRAAALLPLLVFTLMLSAPAQTPRFAQPAEVRVVTAVYAATCVGAANCRACKNCRYCKHCAKKGGTCGVCRRRRHHSH